jgi:hypothetical protein
LIFLQKIRHQQYRSWEKIANLKGQFRREHKKVVASKKTGSSPKKPIWFVYEALLFLLQHNESRGSRSTLTEEGNEVSIFNNSVSDFRLPPRCVGEMCALLGYSAVLSCISEPTLPDNLWVPSSMVKKSKKGFLTLEDGRTSYSWRWVR